MDPHYILLLPFYFLMALCWLGPAAMTIVGISICRRSFSPVAFLMAVTPLLFFISYNLLGYLYQFNRASDLEKLPRYSVIGKHFSKLISLGPIDENESLVISVKHGIKKVTMINSTEDARSVEQVGVVQTVVHTADCKRAAEILTQQLEDYLYPPATPRVRVISSEEAERMFTPSHDSCVQRSALTKLKLQRDDSTLYLYQGLATRYGGKFGITERQYELYTWRGREMSLVDYRDDARPHYIFPFCVPLIENVCDANRSSNYAKPAVLQFLDNNLVKRAQYVEVFSH